MRSSTRVVGALNPLAPTHKQVVTGPWAGQSRAELMMATVAGPPRVQNVLTADASSLCGSFCHSVSPSRTGWELTMSAHHLFFVSNELLWNAGRAFAGSRVTHHRLTHVYTGREFCRFRSRMLSTTTARKNLSLL